MKVRVIDLKKYYKWIFAAVTIFMCILAFEVLIVDMTKIMVQAHGIQKNENVVQAESIQKNFIFKTMFHQVLPIVKVACQEEESSIESNFLRMACAKLMHFDYKDPKSVLKTQICMLDEVDDDLGEIEDKPYDMKNDKEVALGVANYPKVSRERVIDKKKIPQSSVQTSAKVEEKKTIIKEKNDKPLEIISSPVQIKMPKKVNLSTKQPSVFVYHTHATESYMPESVGNFHSLNRKYTVRAVGDQLTSYLKNKGYNVMHNDIMHDYPSYIQSYTRALETLSSNLQKTPTLKVIFDVHRDAAPNNNTARQNSYIVIDGQKVARFSLVVGTQNKNVDQLLLFAEYIKAKSDEQYPGLMKGIIKKPYRFNEYNSDYYALVEIGNTANYIDESVRSTKYIAQIIDSVLRDIKGN